MHHTASILVAEDDDADLFLIQRAFKDAGVANPLEAVHDGQECIDFLENAMRLAQRGEPARLPCLLLLDLKMPRLTGMDVLRWRRDQPIFRTLPVIVFSSSGNQQDVELAYLMGANAFIVKPPTTDERAALARLIDSFWIKLNRPPLMCIEGLAATLKLHATNGFRQSIL